MARCPDCNKFVSLETNEPEEDSIEIDSEPTATSSEESEESEGSGAEGETVEPSENKPEPRTGHISATYRIVRVCADCGTELKEATIEMEEDVEIPAGHEGDDHELEIEGEAESTEKGGGRYAKSFYGVHVHYTVSCSCGAAGLLEGDLEDEVAASHMDELT